MSPFGLMLRYMRNERGISLKSLAARVGISQKSLSAIETGRRHPPDQGLVEKISQALELGATEIHRLRESVNHSSPAIRIPYGATPRAYRLVHRLINRLDRLSARDMESIQAILESRKTGPEPEEGNAMT